MLGLAATAYVALRTSQGLRLDGAASEAVSSPAPVLDRLYEGLSWMSAGSVGLSLVVCVALALVRRRLDLALGAVVVIGGAYLTTQILKYDLFARLGSDHGPNSLPSGHTTVALSIALAALIVALPAWRSIVAIGVSATAAPVGVAFVLGRWHRPSDVIAATFVCLVWAAVGMLIAALVSHRPPAPVHDVSVHIGGAHRRLDRRRPAGVVGSPAGTWSARPRAGHHLAGVHRAGLRSQCRRGRLRG